MSQNFPKVLAKSIYEDFTAGKSDKIAAWASSHSDADVKNSAGPMIKYLKACKNFDEFYTVLNGGTIDTPVKLTPAEMQAVAGGARALRGKVGQTSTVANASKFPWQ